VRKVLLLPLIALLLLAAAPPPAAAHPPRLVLFILVDTLRADHLRLYGYGRDTTPALDRIWREGAAVYTQSYSAAGFTQASETSMLTGVRPSVHNFTTWSRGKTVPVNFGSYLRTRGFLTGFVTANPAVIWFRDSYDRYWGEYLKKDGAYRYHAADRVIAEAEKIVADAGTKDVHLLLQFADTHLPYDPPEYAAEFFTNDRIGRKFEPRFDGMRAEHLAEVTPPVLANMKNRYDAGLRYIDGRLAPFIRRMQRAYPDHLILFTADHGEAFAEHGDAGHGRSMYNSVVRVPLIVIDSRAPKHGLTKNATLVSGLDLFPTLLEWMGESAEGPGVDGRSFLWSLRGGASRAHGRVAVTESPYYDDQGQAYGGCWGMAYFYQPRWGTAAGTTAKLTTLGPRCGQLRYSVQHHEQWFDAAMDFAQVQQLRPKQVNIAAIEPRLAKWPLPHAEDSQPAPKLSPEQIEMLKSLGYLNTGHH
jgi:arylsulfatase A-like enzyme